MKKQCSQRTDQRLPAVFSGLPNFKNEVLVISIPLQAGEKSLFRIEIPPHFIRRNDKPMLRNAL